MNALVEVEASPPCTRCDAQIRRLSIGLEAERIRVRELERHLESELAAARNRIRVLEAREQARELVPGDPSY